ncbi:hypothetical protein AURDEDRAFT_124089 [Auricularia subglabra TFB-10046 SS5]|nr:hypothetical protein AURDEDRAFT_124089 [Auricularia subglabra TFB-10046 SS5]
MSAAAASSRRGISVQVGPDGVEHEIRIPLIVHQFDFNSVWPCECGLQVKVGTGGFRNLETHRTSAEHARHLKLQSKMPAVRKLKDASISSFFKPKAIAPAPPPAAPLRGPDTTSLVAPLPQTASKATVLDVLAAFAIPPAFPANIGADVEAKEALWEDVDATLNRYFGGDCPQDKIAAIIRRGPLGMQALCDWIELHIKEAGIDEVLFHGKVSRLIRAIDGLCSDIDSTPATAGVERERSSIQAQDVIDLTSDTSTAQSPAVQDGDAHDVAEPAGRSNAATNTRGLREVAEPDAHTRCYGFPVDLGPDRVAGAAYPWGMDVSRRFAWRGNVVDEKLYIKSTFCRKTSRSPPCQECSELQERPLVTNVLHRMRHGVSPFTNSLFLSWEDMYDSNGRLRLENNKNKLGALALARKLTRVTGAVNDHDRLVWAIANDDIPRVSAVLKVALNNRRSVRGMLAQVEKAAKHVYRVQSYTEKDFALATLFYRLGGDTISSLASRALGLPSPMTIRRHSHVPAIRVSAGYPTPADIVFNIDNMYPMPIAAPLHGTRTGVVLMIDECKVEERLRWDPSTNLILGTCREHSDHLDLEFRNIDAALAVSSSLKEKTVHLATEMTVAALGPLVRQSRDNVARPIHISGTCKAEDAAAQMNLLRTIVNTASKHAKLRHARIYSIATDGEAKRGKALVPLTLCQTLPLDSPLHPVLSKLPLFNTLCGPDAVTLSKDPKHIFKRMRSTLLRRNGTSVFRTIITPSILKEHLCRAGLSPEHAISLVTESDEAPSEAVQKQVEKHLIGNGFTPSRIRALMNPNDKQDVPLAYSLLVAIMKLPEPDPHDSFQWTRARQALNLLGFMFGSFLRPFVTLTMSASEQIHHLSAGMHTMLALYSEGRGAFVPVQLFADCAHMVKNAVFTLAKTQVDDPDGEFLLCLEGSDRLEDDFGNMRCIVGNDSNADVFQASSRLAAGAEVSIIFADHPEWDRTKRRLQLKALEEQGALLDRGVDHVSPRSWVGDVNVSRVSLRTSWGAGRKSSEEHLVAHGAVAPFERMEAQGDIDILRPLGSYCFNGELLDGEENEDLRVPESNNGTPISESPPFESPDELELDDFAGAELAEQRRADNGPTAASEPWIFATPGDPTSKVYKATVLRYVLDPTEPLGPDSADRLKRVRGKKRFDDDPEDAPPDSGDAGDHSTETKVVVNDIAATLLRCCSAAFTAIVQVSSLTSHSKSVQALHGDMLDDPLNQVGFQVLRVFPRSADDGDGLDWACTADTVRFGCTDSVLTTIAPLIQPLRPVTVIPTDGSPPSMHFGKSELTALTLLLLEKTERDKNLSLPTVKKAAYFPYRLNECLHIADKYCFAAQKPDNSSVGVDKLACDRCSSNVKIESVPNLVNHVAAHILYDAAVRKTAQYCGFCLNSDGKCQFFLRKKGDSPKNQQLDLERSMCPRLPTQFSYGAASKSKTSSPSSNVPLWCPMCPDGSPAVWKYNMKLHFESSHPLADVQKYKGLWKLSREEQTGLSKLWTRIRNSRKGSKTTTAPKLSISEAHSSLMAMSTCELDSDDEPDMDNASRHSEPPAELDARTDADSEPASVDLEPDASPADTHIKSGLSKRTTRFQPRETSPTPDENGVPARSGRMSRNTRQPKADAEPSNLVDPVGEPDDWEDFGIADAITDEGTDSTITVDLSLGAFIATRIPVRKRVDTRTRAEQLKAQERAWKDALPAVVRAYLAWKHRSALARDTPSAAAPSAPAAEVTDANTTGNWFTVAAICDSSAFDQYVAIKREVQRTVDSALGRDTPNWRAINACAPCSYKLEGEPELLIPSFVAMDGGQSMKRSAAAGLADTRIFDTDYRVPPDEVDLRADEVQRRVVPKKMKPSDAQSAEIDAPAFTTVAESGEPGDDAPTPSLCAHRWKNAKADHHKISPGMYEQTGLFVVNCRHGCCAVGNCFGLEDLEICERFFSWINGVGGVVRHSSHYHWLQAIFLGIQQWDEDKYHELNKFLYNNVRQAIRLKEEYEPILNEFKTRTGYTASDIESWNSEERAYLEGLQTEPQEVGLKMDYIAMLTELEAAETALASKQSDYQNGLRAPSEQEIAAKRLSPAAVANLYKARVDAHNKYMKILEAVVALEGVLDIDEGLVQMAERDWRRALDRLELLMVQRMFELAKTHVFGTGYKLREAIGKGLKSRSQAIRTAVTQYNELAVLLNPPAATVNFTTLMEWTELQEFELLRRSRAGDVRERAWAQPANRLITSKHYKVLRADEELVRCRIEARRLATAMHDEEQQLEAASRRLLATNPPLAHELGEVIARRSSLNAMHRVNLAKLAAFPGFADVLIPGTRLGAEGSAATPEHQQASQTCDPAAREDGTEDPLEAEDFEVEEEELHVLHDFIASLHD